MCIRDSINTEATVSSDKFAPSLNPRRVAEASFWPSLNPRRVAANNTAITSPTVTALTKAAAPTTDTTILPSAQGFWPSLKPTITVAAAPVKPRTVAAQRPMTFGGFAIADETDHPPSVFFGNDVAPVRTAALPLAVSLSNDLESEPREITVKLSRGETFVDALRRAGVRAEDRNEAAAAFGKVQNLRTLQPGQEFALVTAAPNQTVYQVASGDGDIGSHLLSLDFRVDPQNKIGITLKNDGEYDAVKQEIPLTKRLVAVEGRIEGSLFVSAKKAGAPTQIIGNLANMFAYDVDFQRDIFGGDEFEAIFEVLYDNEGRMAGAGDILYGRLKWRGKSKEKAYYRLAEENSDKADYYDRAGQSAKRLLMKTPIDGARLSSGFGSRRHPILGYRKAHKGVDFAARRGTPIYAAGDGVVERANRFGSFGNYIRIRHANGYKTAYAHLKGFKRGVRAGKRVRQGDVIGYVGTTGRSTGPHLHYEVHYKGKAVNPQRLKIATGVQLKGSPLDRFKIVRDEIDLMRAPPPAHKPELLANEKADTGEQL